MKISVWKTILFSLLAVIVGFCITFVVADVVAQSNLKTDYQKSVGVQFHFLELGNEFTGDCIYIKSGDTDIIVDAGSRSDSVSTIKSYLDNYVLDGKIEYAIITHADRDHIAGFAGTTAENSSLFDLYEFETIIDFPLTNKTTQTYNRYIEKRNEEVKQGAVHYNALQCYNEENGAKRKYEISQGVELEILYNYYYENNSSDENNYSVCFMINQEDKHFLFTGDLEEKGEEYLVENNELPEVELFKAGHHGSKTSNNDILLSVIKPKIVTVTCSAGSIEYTQNLENTFPTQLMIDRVAKYTDKVYVTTQATIEYDQSKKEYIVTDYGSMNGNIVVTSAFGEVKVECSNNNILLKDTEWFKEYRTMPNEWKN